jgi:hypothetical protein
VLNQLAQHRVTVVIGEPDEAVVERCVKAAVYRGAIMLVPRHKAEVDSILERCASLALSRAGGTGGGVASRVPGSASNSPAASV